MGTTTDAQTVRFLTPAWAEAARLLVDGGPSEEVMETKQESYWEWIADTRAACSQSWALGVREQDGTTSYLRLGWEGGKCAEAVVIAPGEPVEADFVLVGSAETWRRFYAGELNLQRTVVDRKLSLEHGDTLIFFRSIFFFVESLAVLQQVPTRFD
ncbi:SCP2 sterol-binding domain-containing protein [Streptomyces sp. HNA39]|uniref:SCP2 sterol-binding domain-containing protein n=1 Tax=Streptomyces TaxID=1883 RepID=UPI00200C7337|nr:SCP2 sterol-binding domain-containing protein [Streptomyces sp. HNA39]UQA36860.1 SCP2 sterol-binding domain-containing protein [Streptomyces sp. HNA39]